MERKKVYHCPLKSSPFVCNESCAWFDEEWDGCILQTIALELHVLNDILERWAKIQGIDLLDR